MDKDLKEKAIKSKVFNTQAFSDIEGSVKDIEGKKIACWQFKDN